MEEGDGETAAASWRRWRGRSLPRSSTAEEWAVVVAVVVAVVEAVVLSTVTSRVGQTDRQAGGRAGRRTGGASGGGWKLLIYYFCISDGRA